VRLQELKEAAAEQVESVVLTVKDAAVPCDRRMIEALRVIEFNATDASMEYSDWGKQLDDDINFG
jgi:hypothetical protein